ncbi:MAG: hypothetical protein ACR2JT_06285 [Nocardioidaceae bacterium]
MRLTRYEGGSGTEPAIGVTSVAIASWPTVSGTPDLPLDDRGIPLADARVFAIALQALVATEEAT